MYTLLDLSLSGYISNYRLVCSKDFYATGAHSYALDVEMLWRATLRVSLRKDNHKESNALLKHETRNGTPRSCNGM